MGIVSPNFVFLLFNAIQYELISPVYTGNLKSIMINLNNDVHVHLYVRIPVRAIFSRRLSHILNGYTHDVMWHFGIIMNYYMGLPVKWRG